jgi:hypothetical protein
MWNFAIAFSSGHPWLFTFSLLVSLWAAVQPFHYFFLCWNRWLRSRNIKAHGWPTPPIDGDGDVVQREKEA